MADLANVKVLDDKAGTSAFDRERVKVDTSLPFLSVREAVSLFGEKADIRKPTFHEKQAARDAELLHAQEELLKVREQLAIAENVKEKALYELAEVRKSFEHTTEKLKQTDASKTNLGESTPTDVMTVVTMEQAPAYIEEKHVMWEIQLRGMKERHLMALTELESVRQELVQLKQELLASSKEKDAIFKQTEVALAAAEDNAKKADDLTTELAGMNESRVLLKLACMEVNKEEIALLEAKQIDTKASISGNVSESQHSNQESKMAYEPECKLVGTMNELERLKGVMNSTKEGEVKIASLARGALANLKEIRLEIKGTRMPKESATSSLQSLSTELEEAKMTLKKEFDNGAFLLMILESLRTESEMMKKEVAGLKDREANATAMAGVLTGELMNIREELKTAAEAETRAVESISVLSQALEHVKAEAVEAKAGEEALLEDASKYRIDVEQTKLAMQNAESMLQSALQEADTAKAAEAAAIECFESLSVPAYAARASEVDSGAEIPISQDEYVSLKRKVQEAEELANMRMAAAKTEAEAVRTSEQEMVQKVVMLTEDMEKLKTATQQALHRAEMAEAAKLAVEGDLRRLREREQRRKEKEIAITAQQYYMTNVNNQYPSSFTPLPQIEPLANVLNINTTSVGSKTMERTATYKQSQPPVNSLGRILSKGKSSSKKIT